MKASYGHLESVQAAPAHARFLGASLTRGEADDPTVIQLQFKTGAHGTLALEIGVQDAMFMLSVMTDMHRDLGLPDQPSHGMADQSH